MAEKGLSGLKRKFEHDKVYRERYTSPMEGTIKHNYAEKVSLRDTGEP